MDQPSGDSDRSQPMGTDTAGPGGYIGPIRAGVAGRETAGGCQPAVCRAPHPQPRVILPIAQPGVERCSGPCTGSADGPPSEVHRVEFSTAGQRAVAMSLPRGCSDEGRGIRRLRSRFDGTYFGPQWYGQRGSDTHCGLGAGCAARVDCGPWAVGEVPRTVDCELWIIGCELSTVSRAFCAANCGLSARHSEIRSTCALPRFPRRPFGDSLASAVQSLAEVTSGKARPVCPINCVWRRPLPHPSHIGYPPTWSGRTKNSEK